VKCLQHEIDIKLHSYQRLDGQQEEIVRQLTGRYYCKQGIDYFLYEERPGQRIALKVKENFLTMIQSGENNWTHTFRMAQTSSSTYSTPYGAFTLDIHTKRLIYEQKNDSWSLILLYQLLAPTEEETTEIELNFMVRKRGAENENCCL